MLTHGISHPQWLSWMGSCGFNFAHVFLHGYGCGFKVVHRLDNMAVGKQAEPKKIKRRKRKTGDEGRTLKTEMGSGEAQLVVSQAAR